MEYLTNLWNNQPNILIGGGLATLLMLGIYIKITRYLSMKLIFDKWNLEKIKKIIN